MLTSRLIQKRTLLVVCYLLLAQETLLEAIMRKLAVSWLTKEPVDEASGVSYWQMDSSLWGLKVCSVQISLKASKVSWPQVARTRWEIERDLKNSIMSTFVSRRLTTMKAVLKLSIHNVAKVLASTQIHHPRSTTLIWFQRVSSPKKRNLTPKCAQQRNQARKRL